jgi:hypothetical protein
MTKCESSRPDLPHPASGTTTFTQEDDGLHYSNDAVWSDGRKATVSAVLQMDGSWCPVTGSLLTDALSCQRLEDGPLEVKMRKGAANVGTNHTTVSADGQP